MKKIKRRIKAGETLAGCWLNLGSSVTAEIVGLSGYDWVLIDLEHGAGEQTDLLHQLQALEHTPAAALVRVESYQKERIHRVLDLGANGVMVPRIKSATEAKAAIAGIHYPPAGVRGGGDRQEVEKQTVLHLQLHPVCAQAQGNKKDSFKRSQQAGILLALASQSALLE